MSGATLVLSMVDTRNRVLHLVAVDTAALHRRSGRYPALCGTEVLSASMLTAPTRECDDCQHKANTETGTNRQRHRSRVSPSGFLRSRRPRRGRSGRRRRPANRDGGRAGQRNGGSRGNRLRGGGDCGLAGR